MNNMARDMQTDRQTDRQTKFSPSKALAYVTAFMAGTKKEKKPFDLANAIRALQGDDALYMKLYNHLCNCPEVATEERVGRPITVPVGERGKYKFTKEGVENLAEAVARAGSAEEKEGILGRYCGALRAAAMDQERLLDLYTDGTQPRVSNGTHYVASFDGKFIWHLAKLLRENGMPRRARALRRLSGTSQQSTLAADEAKTRYLSHYQGKSVLLWRISDPEFLASVVAAIPRNVDFRFGIAERAAIEKLTDQDTLRDLALRSKDFNVRCAAINGIEDREFLLKMANTPDYLCRRSPSRPWATYDSTFVNENLRRTAQERLISLEVRDSVGTNPTPIAELDDAFDTIEASHCHNPATGLLCKQLLSYQGEGDIEKCSDGSRKLQHGAIVRYIGVNGPDRPLIRTVGPDGSGEVEPSTPFCLL